MSGVTADANGIKIQDFKAFAEGYASDKSDHAQKIITDTNYMKSGAYAYVGNIKEEHFSGINYNGETVTVAETDMDLVNKAREILLDANMEKYGFEEGMVDEDEG